MSININVILEGLDANPGKDLYYLTRIGNEDFVTTYGAAKNSISIGELYLDDLERAAKEKGLRIVADECYCDCGEDDCEECSRFPDGNQPIRVTS